MRPVRVGSRSRLHRAIQNLPEIAAPSHLLVPVGGECDRDRDQSSSMTNTGGYNRRIRQASTRAATKNVQASGVVDSHVRSHEKTTRESLFLACLSTSELTRLG